MQPDELGRAPRYVRIATRRSFPSRGGYVRTYVRRAFSIHLFDPGKITRAFFPPRGGESVTQSCSPNFRERSADAEVTDVNLPPRICDPLVLPRMSSRSDVAPKTARPGRRGAVVTDNTKRPRICDPLTLARTVRRRAPQPRTEVTDVSSVPVGCNTSKGCHARAAVGAEGAPQLALPRGAAAAPGHPIPLSNGSDTRPAARAVADVWSTATVAAATLSSAPAPCVRRVRKMCHMCRSRTKAPSTSMLVRIVPAATGRRRLTASHGLWCPASRGRHGARHHLSCTVSGCSGCSPTPPSPSRLCTCTPCASSSRWTRRYGTWAPNRDCLTFQVLAWSRSPTMY